MGVGGEQPEGWTTNGALVVQALACLPTRRAAPDGVPFGYVPLTA